MTKNMRHLTVIAGLVLAGASAVQAQTLTPQPETGAFVSIAVGGQPQKRSFGSSGSFPSFNEVARFEVNQNVGSGSLFDIAGGYQFMKRLAAGVSVWRTGNKSAVSAAASIPDPLFFGRFTTVNANSQSDLSQSTLGINFDLIYTMPIMDRFDLAVSLGPSIIRTKLEVGTVAVTANSRTITLSTEDQSKTTAKAGNLGFDFSYRMNEMYNVGAFVRYAGGEVDLPAITKMKVGGVQAGGIVRYRF
jgi:Outer membrane protein beta-barrel domain